MRKGWRKPLLALIFLLAGGTRPEPVSGAVRLGDSAPRGGERAVRVAVEVVWSTAPQVEAAGQEVELEVSDGRIVDALSWPRSGSPASDPRARSERVWRLGSERAGRVRAQVEVPVAASLILRAGGQMMRFPVPLVLEGRQSSPPQAPVEISVERLPWDALTLTSLGSAEPANDARQTKPTSVLDDGVVVPGSTVPLGVALNLVTAETGEVLVSGTAELRPLHGGDAIWTDEWREVVATDALPAAVHPLQIKIPAAIEGLYVLEVRASWEPSAPGESSNSRLIGRLIRRGRRTGASGPSGHASRRVTLAAVAPREADPAASASKSDRNQEVDTFDLARMRANRPSAAGRSPLAQPGRSAWPLPEGALVEVTRRDRLSGWMQRVGPEVAQLGPADPSGLAWSAVGLKVAHPGRPHRLTLAVTAGHPSSLGVAVVGPSSRAASNAQPFLSALQASGTAPGGPRLLLDACGSGPPILPAGPPATFSWIVWPDTTDPVLVLVNRGTVAPVHVGNVVLTELPDLPPAPPVEPPQGVASRDLGLALTGPDVLDRFALRDGAGAGLPDPLTAARNLTRYAIHCGASAVLLSEELSDRDRRRALDGQAGEDCLGPDRLDLTLRMLRRQHVGVWLELALNGTLPGLPAPDSPEAAARNLVRVDRRGVVDGPVAAYHPLAPEVARALERKVTETITRHAGSIPGAGLAGVVVRLGPGPTLLGASDTGFDDATYDRFAREAFDHPTGSNLPGAGSDDPERFAARARFLGGSGRMPWLTWRSKQVASLYGNLASAAAKAAPGVVLAVVTPTLDDSHAATEARRADLAGLAPSLAWRAVGLDLAVWSPAGDDGTSLSVIRGVSLSPDELARDLATNPELDAEVAARPGRGLLLDLDRPAAGPSQSGPGLALVALPLDSGPAGDEPLGHALAALDARWVWLAGPMAAGHEERLRSFSRLLRSLPSTPPSSAGQAPATTFGVTVRAHPGVGQTFVALANDTPFPVRLESVLAASPTATFDDMGRGARLKPVSDATGHHLVLDLLPFGVSVVRVSAPDVKVASVMPYPSDAVLTTLQARFEEVSAQLSRLSRKSDAESGGPSNGQFEPTGPGARTVAMNLGGAAPPVGWQLKGGNGAALQIDPVQHHAGQGSLRLDAPQTPASAESDPFELAGHPGLLVRAWLRSDRPNTRLRLWIEGQTAGQSWRRVSELTAQPDWLERAVRAGDVPAAGLEAVRLRFELLTPGSLWIDDLTVTSGTLSDPERRNARNTLLAAIQAYREKRYADFARLAGSRWARVGGAIEAPAAPAVAGTRGGLDGAAVERPGMLRTGDASALPQGRRLR